MPRRAHDELFVQFMRGPMALAAFRETLMHCRGVRFGAMAALALRDHFVFLLVAGGAFQFGMLGRALFQFFIRCGMTAAAVAGGGARRVCDILRHVGLVAGQAILLRLSFGVRRMTIGAVGNKAVAFAVAG